MLSWSTLAWWGQRRTSEQAPPGRGSELRVRAGSGRLVPTRRPGKQAMTCTIRARMRRSVAAPIRSGRKRLVPRGLRARYGAERGRHAFPDRVRCEGRAGLWQKHVRRWPAHAATSVPLPSPARLGIVSRRLGRRPLAPRSRVLRPMAEQRPSRWQSVIGRSIGHFRREPAPTAAVDAPAQAAGGGGGAAKERALTEGGLEPTVLVAYLRASSACFSRAFDWSARRSASDLN
ncbi:Uncharacterised protein [Achromobacter ruhlandii]|nr:Uncharacterised protein [Achromobacter ruhlandii]